MMIHATAIIDPDARLDPTVRVGPYAVVDAGVQVGPHSLIGPHVHLTGNTVIGSHNHFFSGSVIGEAPQDLKYGGEPTGLQIGDHNVFREHVTVHRSAKSGESTAIGSHNYLMAQCHVGHNCHVGNHVIMANGALLGGHVQVQDKAFISAYCLVHQFIRVGTLSMMQGKAGVSMDLPPYTVARDNNRICGLNTVGLRRAGISPEERLELKSLYRILFRSGLSLQQALAQARPHSRHQPSRILIEFVETSTRGLAKDTGKVESPDKT